MGKAIFTILCLACSIVFAQKDYTKFVLPNVGTENDGTNISNGNLFPCISIPYAMNNWSPQTKENNDRWIYNYSDNKINAIRLTRMPSPWIGDYTPIGFMATIGKKTFLEKDRASWFSHKAEIIQPNYYKVYLADYDTSFEMTPSNRCAIMRITYPETENANLIIDLFDAESTFEIDLATNTISGYNTWARKRSKMARSAGKIKNYFVIKFDTPISETSVFNEGKIVENVKKLSAKNRSGIIVSFKTSKQTQIIAKIATSFVSIEQAKVNLSKEIESVSFDTQKQLSKDIWNKYLSKIDVKDNDIDSIDDLRMFYTAFYRTLIYPRDFFEITADGKKIHFSPFNGEVEDGVMTTDNGFWDTFRALHPLLNFILPERSALVMEGLKNTYKESGWLPEWASPGHVRCMIGQNSASIIASAHLLDICKLDTEILWKAIYNGANNRHPEINSVGRWGAEYYNKLGYVPNDIGIPESASRTLEYAYNDFCIMKLAEALGKDKSIIDTFAKRAKNYKSLYNEKYALMTGKNSKGEFRKNFNPVEWGGDFTEGNSLHYSWSVFHDFQGLANLMGGKAKAAENLDKIFSMPPIYDCGTYKIVIHEIREMLVSNLKQYAHGNQPIQHGAYIYNWFSQPWKSQFLAREIMKKLYKPVPDGYCGDEDNGQTSAWYVFSAMGFYPVCPPTGEFVIGSPLFKNVVVKMPNEKTLNIIAKNNSEENVYIKSVTFNGKCIDRNFLTFKELREGGTLIFEMSAIPNKTRGIKDDASPYSMSKTITP